MLQHVCKGCVPMLYASARALLNIEIIAKLIIHLEELSIKYNEAKLSSKCQSNWHMTTRRMLKKSVEAYGIQLAPANIMTSATGVV